MSGHKVLSEAYRVWFEDGSGNRRYTDVPRHKGIAEIREGLWINKEFQYSVGMDACHWIPPARLVLVTKLTVELEA